jgi:hypothetical protein
MLAGGHARVNHVYSAPCVLGTQQHEGRDDLGEVIDAAIGHPGEAFAG